MKRFFIWIAAATSLSACATVSTQMPDIPAPALEKERAQQERVLFSTMENHGARLNRITAKVLRANAPLCAKTRPEIGVTTQSLKSYPKQLRDMAQKELGLSEKPSLVYVRPGSPAQKAGLKSGDFILGDDGNPVSAPSKNMTQLLQKTDTLRIIRGQKEMDIAITPESFCDYPVKLKMTAVINAYANGRKMTVTAGMMDFAKSDDELAYIIGHELAHNNLGHIRKMVTNSVLTLFADRYVRPFEAEADYAGLYYMVRAGYNPNNVEDFWRRLARLNSKPVYKAAVHPTFPSRTLAIEATRAEIRGKEKSGAALKPEPKVSAADKT